MSRLSLSAFQMLTSPANDTGHLHSSESSAAALSAGLSVICLIQFFLRPIPTLLPVDDLLCLRDGHTSTFMIHRWP